MLTFTTDRMIAFKVSRVADTSAAANLFQTRDGIEALSAANREEFHSVLSLTLQRSVVANAGNVSTRPG